MRQEFRPDYRLIFAFLLAAVIVLSGCTPKQSAAENTMKLGDWIQHIYEEAGLAESDQTAPYYLSITGDQPCYAAVQSAVDWGILDPSDGFDPDETLTREWAAYTLSRLKEADLPDVADSSIVDLSRSLFPKEVKYAVRIGLLDLDEQGRFHPKEAMDTAQAMAALKQVVSWMDAWVPEETSAEVEWINGEEPLYSEDFRIQEDGTYQDERIYEEGDTIYSYPDDTFYRIENGQQARALDEDEVFGDIDYEYAGELDLSNAQVEPLEQSFVPGGFSPLVNTFSYEDWKVRTSIQSSGVRAEIFKEYDTGGRTFAAFSLHHIRPVIRWKMKGGKLDDSCMKISFTTTESVGAKASVKRYGDFSQLSEKLRSFLSEKKSAMETTIPLATLRIPLPEIPGLNLVLRLELQLGADGRAELVLTQNHALGFEVRNGSMRSLNSTEGTVQAQARANAWLSGGVNAALAMGKKRLADVALHTGIKTQCKTTLHLYDSNQRHSAQALPVSSELFEENERQLICADLTAETILKTMINSSSTLAGKFGFSKTFDLLGGKGKITIDALTGHLESGMLVTKCTRGERDTGIHREAVDDGAIQLEQYVLFLKNGESKKLPIVSLPEGTGLDQLRFRSSQPSVRVSAGGEVTGVAEGSAIVSLETADGRYRAVCSVIVRGT